MIGTLIPCSPLLCSDTGEAGFTQPLQEGQTTSFERLPHRDVVGVVDRDQTGQGRVAERVDDHWVVVGIEERPADGGDELRVEIMAGDERLHGPWAEAIDDPQPGRAGVVAGSADPYDGIDDAGVDLAGEEGVERIVVAAGEDQLRKVGGVVAEFLDGDVQRVVAAEADDVVARDPPSAEVGQLADAGVGRDHRSPK